MATITPTVSKPRGSQKTWLVIWAAIGDSDTCTEVSFPDGADMTVQIVGTFNSATVVLQGSNDKSNWATLTDPQGNAISKSSAGLEAVEEHPLWVRPSSSGGTASSTTVILLVTGQPQ